MSSFDYTWIAAVISMLASYFNIKKNAICFYLWSLTLMFYVVIDIQNKQYGRTFLDVFLLGVNIYGLIVWKRDKKVK